MLATWIPHAQDHGLGQGYSTVRGQVRGVDEVSQGCDIQRLRGTVVGNHHGLENALGALFKVKVRPVDGRCPVRVLDALRRGEHAGRAGLQLDHGQASGQVHLKIDVFRGFLASYLDGDLGLLSACQDPALGIGLRLGAQNQIGTVLSDGGRRPGAAQDGKQGEDKGQVHGFRLQRGL